MISFIWRAVALLVLILVSDQSHARRRGDYLRLVVDSSDRRGYINGAGDTVIPCGKYAFCYTEEFRDIAFVSDYGIGTFAIDRAEKKLFDAYPFDNGPDEPSCGLFRMKDRGKIGYADMKGRIVIPAKYDCAFPFERNRAKVGTGCQRVASGEYHSWTGGQWEVINKRGKVIRRLPKNPHE